MRPPPTVPFQFILFGLEIYLREVLGEGMVYLGVKGRSGTLHWYKAGMVCLSGIEGMRYSSLVLGDQLSSLVFRRVRMHL